MVKTTVSRASVEATLSEWNEFEIRVGKHALIIGNTNIEKAKELLARMWAFAQGWRCAFKECDDVNDYVGCFKDHILDYVNQLKLRSEEHTSELQSLRHIVCRLL